MRVWLGALLLLFSLDAAAEIYKWVDASGTVHFEDRKPSDGRYEQVRIQSMSGVQVYRAPTSGVKRKTADAAAGKRVVMYGTGWCAYCKKARQYFQANNIPYQEYDIESSATAKAEYDALNGKGVPLILVDDSIMNGFSIPSFSRLYFP